MSPVVSSPAVSRAAVYVGSSDGSVYAFPAAGCGTDTCPALWRAAAETDPRGSRAAG